MPRFDPLEIFARNFDVRTSDFEAGGWLDWRSHEGVPARIPYRKGEQ